MEPYRNLSGTSGVVAYQLGDDYIIVQFNGGADTFYKYTHTSAGSAAVGTMKSLAQQGYGLNTYISKNQPGYSSKASSLTGLR